MGDRPSRILHKQNYYGMSKLQKINDALKVVAFPESIRQRIVKFYLLNIELGKRTYDREISSEQVRNMLSVWDMVLTDTGWMRSMMSSECADAQGNPIPWYTLPAIEYLSKLDWSSSDVFEFGCGNSTIWWSRRAKSVTSVEDSKQWYEQVRARTGSNCHLKLVTNPEAYAEHVLDFDGFDVVIIDGIFQNGGRLKCTESAIKALRPGGLIILDNSDWLPRSSQRLRETGHIEVDMAGVAPLNTYACTTSLFFSRDFSVRPASKYHPAAAIGGITQNWED
jgi:SAM-dependent methyltransferase